MNNEYFKTVDEAVADFVPCFLNHNGNNSLAWTLSKNKSLLADAEYYINIINRVMSKIEDDDIEVVAMLPAQFKKTAFRYSIVSKCVEHDVSVTANNYLRMYNYAVTKDNFYVREFRERFQDLKLRSCGLEDAKKIGHLISAIRAFAEIIYCDEHTIGGQTFGPYPYASKQLLIHHYSRLRPIELYDDIVDFRIQSLTVFCLYNDTSINIDTIGNISYSQNPIETLSAYCIELTLSSGKHIRIDSSEIEEVVAYIDSWIIRKIGRHNSYCDRQIQKLTHDVEFYAILPMLRVAGINYDFNRDSYFSNKNTVVRNPFNNWSFGIGVERSDDAFRFIDPRSS